MQVQVLSFRTNLVIIMNYNKHSEVIQSLKDDQHAEHDSRNAMDESIKFHGGEQWEDFVKKMYDGRPQYTFDQTKPTVSGIWAEMAMNDYAAKVDPVGEGATEDQANLRNDILRAIYSQSAFDDTSTKVGKKGIIGGFGAVKIRAGFIGESFYQDIIIDYVPDAHRRVWFEAGSELQTREDANHVHVLSANISQEEAKRRWGKRRTYVSVDDDRQHEEEYKPKDRITIGEVFYKRFYQKDIYLIDDETNTVTDDAGLKRMGIEKGSKAILGTRSARCFDVYSRKYDGKNWLGEAKKTAFKLLPVVPMYAYFDVNDGKVMFEGAIARIIDACRVFNYSESRKVEESVLAMRQKLAVDDRVIGQYSDEFTNINRDPRAVIPFDGAAADKIKHAFGPMQTIGGAAPNPAVTEISNDMLRNVQISTGRANAIDQVANDSDYRADLRESMGSVGTFEYYKGYKVFLEQVMKVCLGAVPIVYDTRRKLTRMDEAGQTSEVEVNSVDATGNILNDLTVGKFTSTVSISDNMESRKAQANDGIISLAQFDPSIVTRNTDILASNMSAPGMDLVADRERERLFQQGAIPQDQLTEKEIEAVQAQANQPPPPDPATIIAQAEQTKVQAEALRAQAELELKQLELNGKQQVEAVKLELQKSKQDYDNLLKAVQAEKLSTEINQPIDQSVVNKAESEI